eukprot:756711-Hanusia_phi.AAC.5
MSSKRFVNALSRFEFQLSSRLYSRTPIDCERFRDLLRACLSMAERLTTRLLIVCRTATFFRDGLGCKVVMADDQFAEVQTGEVNIVLKCVQRCD